jgi:CYTH domain-containing protein
LKEIERQFLCRPMASEALDGAREAVRIHQGYLTTGDPAVRVRLWNEDWILGVKAGHGLVREEVEVSVDAEAGRTLMAIAGDRRLEKTRYLLGPWELDIFGGKLEGLVVLEIELERENAPTPPLPPGVEVIREVTGRAGYRNQALAGLSPTEARRFVAELYGPPTPE